MKVLSLEQMHQLKELGVDVKRKRNQIIWNYRGICSR